MSEGPEHGQHGQHGEHGQHSKATEDGMSGGGGGAVHIGSMSGGAIATGAHGSAVYQEAPRGDARTGEPDEATRALLEAVRTLREQLRVLAASDETAEADGELATVEDEITRTGSAEPGRLARLRERLETGATAAAALASAASVTQAIGQLLG